jgi:uncharacterized oligopeptide transporter (OPT) family protein
VSALVAMAVAAVAAVAMEIARMATRGRFPLSAVSIGLGVVLPPESCLAMWIGADGLLDPGQVYDEAGTQAQRHLGRRARGDLRGPDLRGRR